MIAEYNRKSLILGVPGLILQIGCVITSNFLAAQAKTQGTGIGLPIALSLLAGQLTGVVLLIIGLGYYAKAKGRSIAWGLLGLLSCIGLLILLLLSDKTKNQSS